MSHFTFVLTYKNHSYGQYRMHGSVINVIANVNQTQFILSYIPYDKAIIGMFFNILNDILNIITSYVRTRSFKHNDVCFVTIDQNAII